MREAAYPGYLTAAVAAYADDNVAAGRWPTAGALLRSRDQFASLLPQGLTTPNQHLFEILQDADGQAVGWLWLAIEPGPDALGGSAGFVYNLEIAAGYRRQGHAARAFGLLEPIASKLGARRIELHVFANNAGAQALYRKLGYGVTGMNMSKAL